LQIDFNTSWTFFFIEHRLSQTFDLHFLHYSSKVANMKRTLWSGLLVGLIGSLALLALVGTANA
jgi:hypothetical protein